MLKAEKMFPYLMIRSVTAAEGGELSAPTVPMQITVRPMGGVVLVQ